MCSIQIPNNISQNQYYMTSYQKSKSVTFRATTKIPKQNTSTDIISLGLKRYDELYKNHHLLLDFPALHFMNLKNLRFINENFISGATLEHRCDSDLAKIRTIGIRKIIDLRSEATKEYGERCEKLGFVYDNIPFDDVYNLQNPNYFIHEKNKPTQVTDKFVKTLEKMFQIINSGDVYLGCEYGIDRTNIALVLNYLLNKQPKPIANSDNPPLLLMWPEEQRKQVFNRNVKAVKKIFKALTESQKIELNLGSNYDDVLKERISKLFERNKRALFGRYL